MDKFLRPTNEILGLPVAKKELTSLVETIISEAQKTQNPAVFFTDQLKDWCVNIFGITEETFQKFILNVKYDGETSKIQDIVSEFYGFLLKEVGAKTIESNIRKFQRSTLNPENDLNDLLFFEIDGTNLSLHVHPASTLSLTEKLKELHEGFAKIADKLLRDPKLKDIQKITANSWIVASQPKLITKLGFEILPESTHQTPNTRSAWMSKEDFIKLYGK